MNNTKINACILISFHRLDNQGNVKVADFGLAEDVYTKGYFRQETDASVRLPYKWMPPESLQDMVFSEKSDVVCIGICLGKVSVQPSAKTGLLPERSTFVKPHHPV